MKSYITIMFAGLLVGTAIAMATMAQARDAVVGLSPNQSPEELQVQIERLIGHAIATLEPGETMHFFDAADATLIASFTAPEGTGAGNPKTMVQANRTALAGLQRFIKSATPQPGRVAHMNLPAFLRAIRAHYPAGADGADLIVLGAPITDDPQAPSLSMQGGRVPNDGHIAARAGQSIYATDGLPGSLDGYDVYFGLIGEPWKISDAHGHYVDRFWALSVEASGASLAFFGDDLNTLFALAGRDAPDRVHGEPLVPTNKLEMLQFAPDTGAVSDIYSAPLVVTPAPEPVWRAARNAVIGVTWDVQGVDLDLYVRPDAASPVIFFQQADTPQGRLYKDYTLSPGTGFETVALKDRPVDLSGLHLAVNYYGGVASPQGVSGEIRISIGNQVWAAPFKVAASHGNRGLGAEAVLRDQVLPNDAWVIIDPMEVLGVQ
ncbi:MAG: hypothetical protein KDA50_06475 [Rhodobacteraceae bacterium]|nr:hypothetical protein [Paracoccaceae bacterium]